ncbi:MAG TPA: hypothetical protein VFT19_07070, partial [Solirubrobacterales bacterium]|nr:hypothetical protein [Solirubrobacterales bacterium]
RNRWKPYARDRIAQAFEEWASLNGGKAPSKKDWSHERDPEGRWPRPGSESFKKAIEKCAQEDGISLSRRAPHRNDPEHLARRTWREARHLRLLADGRVEQAQGSYLLGSKIDEVAARWTPTADERAEIEAAQASADPGPYCVDCFHGSGCQPPEMSYWQYAVEVIGGLHVRLGCDSAATRSRRAEFGRNRQMVTAGVADAFPASSDPAVGAVIETLSTG